MFTFTCGTLEVMAVPALALTPQLLRDTIADLNVSLTAAEYKAAFLLLSVYWLGVDPYTLANFTGLPRRYVNESLQRMIDRHMLVDGRLVDIEWFKGGPHASISFYCDVLMTMTS